MTATAASGWPRRKRYGVLCSGVLTEKVLAKLRPWLPALDDLVGRAEITPARLFGLITVEAL